MGLETRTLDSFPGRCGRKGNRESYCPQIPGTDSDMSYAGHVSSHCLFQFPSLLDQTWFRVGTNTRNGNGGRGEEEVAVKYHYYMVETTNVIISR